ncbi:MAG: helix-turn-helix domain-containing protein [Elusimicrobiota bacterium]
MDNSPIKGGTSINDSQKQSKEVMDIKELSEYLGIGKSKIYSLIRQKKIPASRIGRQYRFSKQVVDSWLKEKIITEKDDKQPSLFKVQKDAANS